MCTVTVPCGCVTKTKKDKKPKKGTSKSRRRGGSAETEMDGMEFENPMAFDVETSRSPTSPIDLTNEWNLDDDSVHQSPSAAKTPAVFDSETVQAAPKSAKKADKKRKKAERKRAKKNKVKADRRERDVTHADDELEFDNPMNDMNDFGTLVS